MNVNRTKSATTATWPKRIVEWVEENTAYLSVPFTWNLPAAYQRCIWYKSEGYQVKAGGPAVSLMPSFLADVAEIGGKVDALTRHNPNAVFTSRGCIRSCSFCAVPKIEGALVELTDWQPRPIVCDNNLLACSRAHFGQVIDRLKPLAGIDFNQGLDAQLLQPYHIDRLRELKLSVVRLAWDNVKAESIVIDSVNALLAAGFSARKIRVYVLVNFQDTPDDALYRCERLKAMNIFPWPQRYNPLDTLKKNSYLAPGWNEEWLRAFLRYWSRQNWLKYVPFAEYTRRGRNRLDGLVPPYLMRFNNA